MTLSEDDVYGLHLSLRGLVTAADRFLDARHNAEAAWAAGAETGFWICVCDDGFNDLLISPDETTYKDMRDGDGNGKYIPAIRWARNRMTHQRWIGLEKHYGTEVGSWVVGKGVLGTSDHMKWATTTNVPEDPRREWGRATYEKSMMGKPIKHAIESARAWLVGPALNELNLQSGQGLAVGPLPRIWPPVLG